MAYSFGRRYGRYAVYSNPLFGVPLVLVLMAVASLELLPRRAERLPEEEITRIEGVPRINADGTPVDESVVLGPDPVWIAAAVGGAFIALGIAGSLLLFRLSPADHDG